MAKPVTLKVKRPIRRANACRGYTPKHSGCSMRSLIIFVCLLALTACADDAVDRARLVDTTDAVADVSTNVDASEGDALADAVEIIEADVVDEPDVAADTNTDTCTCSTVGPCCRSE